MEKWKLIEVKKLVKTPKTNKLLIWREKMYWPLSSRCILSKIIMKAGFFFKTMELFFDRQAKIARKK